MKKLLLIFAVSQIVLQLVAAPRVAKKAQSRVVASFPGVEVISIQDQPMMMSGALFRHFDPSVKPRVEGRYRASLNVFLIRDGKNGKNFLIDAGYGKAESGLLKQLAGLGVKPGDISAVFITHIHPDHVGGLTSPDGKAVFPNAAVYIARQEYDAWRKDSGRRNLSVHLEPYGKRIVLLDYDREVVPYGLTPLYYPGHTPGHTVYRMKIPQPGKAEKNIYFVGDIVHAAALQIPQPEYCARFDMDPETAVKSRRELLLNADHWFGAHIPFPGGIRIIRKQWPSGESSFTFQMLSGTVSATDRAAR